MRALIPCLTLVVACIPTSQGDAESDRLLQAVLTYGLRQPLVVPEVSEVQTLAPAEQAAILDEIESQTARGLNTPGARLEQAMALREMFDYVQSPEFEQSLEWTGPIEGVQPGMTVDELVDSYFGIMDREIETYSREELEALRDEIAASMYSLVDLEGKVELGPETVAQDELDYLFARLAQFRERVQAELDSR